MDTLGLNVFENQVKVSAAYAINRKKLHDYLFEEDHNSSISLPEEVTKNELHSKAELAQEKSEENEIEPLNEFTVDKKETEEKEVDPLNQQIISSAISSSILLEVDNQIPDFNSNENIEEKEEPQFKEVDKVNFNESEKHSFSSWIHHFDDPIAKQTSHQFENVKSYLPATRTKSEFYSPSKMAKLSVQEDDDLVTETLANLYEQQGHTEKAIKAFEKLQLKVPEKKIYFAGRIEKLKDQYNSL